VGITEQIRLGTLSCQGAQRWCILLPGELFATVCNDHAVHDIVNNIDTFVKEKVLWDRLAGFATDAKEHLIWTWVWVGVGTGLQPLSQ